MKPLSIVLSINISFLLIFFLFFAVIIDRPEIIPLFCGFLTLLNLLFAGGFLIDKRKDIGLPFLFGFLVTLALTIIGFVLIGKYGPQIRGDEIVSILQLQMGIA